MKARRASAAGRTARRPLAIRKPIDWPGTVPSASMIAIEKQAAIAEGVVAKGLLSFQILNEVNLGGSGRLDL